MRTKLTKTAAIALLLLCLGGCIFRGVDQLYELPKTSDTFLNLQQAIDEVKGSAESIAPTSGGRTQAIQLFDLLADGTQEAIAFFRDPSAEKPLKIAIFRATESENYELYAMIENAGSEIGSIEYVDLLGGKELELVVSWQTSTVQNLVAYSITEGRVEELMRSGYSRYLSADIDNDGKSELYLCQIDSASPDGNHVEMYAENGGVMQLYSSAFLSNGVVPLMERGYLREGIPAIFVTSGFGDNYRVTDVIAQRGSAIRNITMDEASRRSTATTRIHTGLSLMDINEDGVVEIPVPVPIHSPEPSGDNFWNTLWKQFDAEGRAYVTMQTYHNNNDGWYLILPEEWEGKITLSRSETTTSARGERAVIFSHWEGDPEIKPEPFLTIYRITGANREEQTALGARFRLIPDYQDSEAVYAAEIHPAAFKHGMDEAGVKARFQPIINLN